MLVGIIIAFVTMAYMSYLLYFVLKPVLENVELRRMIANIIDAGTVLRRPPGHSGFEAA